jgi:hypothetical protein
MKKIALLVGFLTPFLSWAQPEDDIVYYTDSKVNNSRFALAANFNPMWTDLRIIDDNVGLGGGGFNVDEDLAEGTLQFNYHLDLIFKLNASFEISVGFGQAFGGYNLESTTYFGSETGGDTIIASDEVAVSMFTVPVKINFNSSISDVFDLEVVPTIELNFIDQYRATFTPLDGAPAFTEDFTDDTQSINYSVGIALGGTYWFADKWGVFVRGGVKYMLNQMVVDIPDFPRETLLNYGGNVGLRYNF